MSPSLPRNFLKRLALLATELAPRLEASLLAGYTKLKTAHESLQSSLGREIPAAECAEMLSQAIAANLPLVAARKEVFEVAGRWLLAEATAWERLVLEEVLSPAYSAPCTEYSVLSAQYLVPGTPCSPHLFEHFLAEHRRHSRKRGGVFYTPPELVDFICRRVHQQLREEFGLPGGLAAATILDPAAGSGAFLLGAIEVIHAGFDPADDWNDYVARHLLPRLLGIEIIPAACLAAKLNIAVKLFDTGFDFQRMGRIRVELGNSLAGDRGPAQNLPSALCPLQSPLAILGNPPFSSLSDNRGRWITELVRGTSERPGYAVTADERLGEKKTWLHDDYVKFIRYAQWLIEESGSGIVGFVTNHGYLDNVTFRLMRRELLRVFSRIDVIDLHGNRKKGETKRGREEFSREGIHDDSGLGPRKPLPTPSHDCDENVFVLDQGIAIGFFRRLAGRTAGEPATVRYAELWGTREDKLKRLAAEPIEGNLSAITSKSPSFLFTPAAPPTAPEYAAGWRLPDAMPVNTTAPVTARDYFVVAHTREELHRRIAEFRDLSIPDEEIRSRYFTRTRSAKYPSGDTRSWKLPAARRTIAAEDNWQSFIRRCLYRPFDWRYVFWHPAMIDWPRTAVVKRLQIGDCRLQNALPQSAICNLPSAILLSRRQMLPTQPCSFFWMADTLPLDGVIRSDNRGSESLFPLYLNETAGNSSAINANFAPDFIAAAAQRLQLAWLPHGRGDLAHTFGPEDLLHYIYALFHSPTYRERYAAELRIDFPRVLLPQRKPLFQDLVPRGERLSRWHTLQGPAPEMNGVSGEALNSFRAGGHQVLKSSRKDIVATRDHPLAPYIAATLAEMSAIDDSIQRHGGFPAAFGA